MYFEASAFSNDPKHILQLIKSECNHPVDVNQLKSWAPLIEIKISLKFVKSFQFSFYPLEISYSKINLISFL